MYPCLIKMWTCNKLRFEERTTLTISVKREKSSMYATKLLSFVYDETSCPDASLRRSSLIREMKNLENEGKHCFQCPGHCCTFEHNSMLIDPLQALELYVYLDSNNMLESTLTKLRQNIIDFRLDKDFLLGRGKQIRRYYTCPFFKHESCGCPIDPSFKPYGCLAFNPTVTNVSLPGSCTSNISILESRSQDYERYENQANEIIKNQLKIYWDKKPIPVALVELYEQVKTLNI